VNPHNSTADGQVDAEPGTDRIAWPPERFYWSVVDAPGVRRAGTLPEGLRDDLQQDLPVQVDDLHAVFAPTGDGRLVVCAARREDLGGVEPSCLTLTPQALPGSIAAFVDCGVLNLLNGEFEPRPLRRARIRRHLSVAALVLTAGVILSVGMLRRAAQWDSVSRDAEAASGRVLSQVGTGSSAESVRAELARLGSATETAATFQRSPDTSLLLASLLDAWPSTVPSKPQSISATPTNMSVSVAVEGDAAPFLRAFKPPTGWRLEEPRLNTAGSVTRLSLQMKPVQEGAQR
jgi:hypothetical protein